jgi:hypothetical protein
VVRHRFHQVVKLGKYREALEWASELDRMGRAKGHTPTTFWAPTFGPMNVLIMERDYRDLGHYSEEQDKFNMDKDLMTHFRKGVEFLADGHWPHDEVLEDAPQLA